MARSVSRADRFDASDVMTILEVQPMIAITITISIRVNPRTFFEEANIGFSILPREKHFSYL